MNIFLTCQEIRYTLIKYGVPSKILSITGMCIGTNNIMTISRPFTFILHVINKNQDITDVTITGIAHRTKDPGIKVEHISFSVSRISLDRDDIQNISALIDMEQVNNSCFNYASGVFAEENRIERELQNFSLSGKPFISAIAS